MGTGGRPGRETRMRIGRLRLRPAGMRWCCRGAGITFLRGFAAKGAETVGRYVTVGAGRVGTDVVAYGERTRKCERDCRMGWEACMGAMMLLALVTIEDLELDYDAAAV